MWKKLFSNSGLILLAVLAVGIWFSNVRSIYQAKAALPATQAQAAKQDFGEFMAQRRQELRELGQRVKAKYPGAYDDLSDEEVGRKVKAKYPDTYHALFKD